MPDPVSALSPDLVYTGPFPHPTAGKMVRELIVLVAGINCISCVNYLY